jgi:pyruvate decarboxylase
MVKVSDSESLNAAVKDILARIHLSVKPVLLGGPKLKKASAINEFKILKNALGCGFANLPDAKGLFDEDNEDYLGTYWAGISSPDSVQPVVENTDLLIVAGALMSDYTTVGWTALYSPEKFIQIFPNHAIVCGRLYSNVLLADLLGAVALKAPLKNATINAFLRFSEENCHTPSPPPTDMNISLTLHEVHRQVQDLMTPITSLIVEAGDSWFFGQRMKLPYGAKYYWQMQYGSIGWATGATLGIALAEGRTREVVAIIGDGAFQVTAQEVSTMIRQHVKATIFLMNNRGYTAEVEIHDGPYNDIKNWNYAGIMEVFNAGEGDGIGIKVQTAEELKDAIHTAEEHKGVTLIEVTIDRDDCTVALLQFGSKVAKANGRI